MTNMFLLYYIFISCSPLDFCITSSKIPPNCKKCLDYSHFGQILCRYFNWIQDVSLLENEGVLVETSLGTIKGHHQKSYGGTTFSAFEGIPYAKPPIGDLRFEEPVEIEPWTGIWEATEQQTCIQLNQNAVSTHGTEDCLYINVYVPRKRPITNENLDVVVHIHGGAFMMGGPNQAGPKYLMDRNIIYVNLNYRLNVLGFLSTEDSVVSGNNGLKDQTLALKWVQSHIRSFGGNSNSVTIIGLSAGGASVHFHYFSPLSKGLFHRGISQSGTALAPWAIQETPLKITKKLGASIGCPTSSTKELVNCLNQRSARDVIKNSYNLFPVKIFAYTPFSLVIEKDSKFAFITDYPYKLLKNGNINNVPWITSATTHEGIFAFDMITHNRNNFDKDWDQILPYFLDYDRSVSESRQAEVTQKIKKFYFKNDKIDINAEQELIKVFGDRQIYCSLELSARMHAKLNKSPVYSYLYGYTEDTSRIPKRSYKPIGVNHGDDAKMLYNMEINGTNFMPKKLTDEDEKVKNLFIDMVTSFAKTGTPECKGVKWEPVKSSGNFKFLFIHNDGIQMKTQKELGPSEFWRSLGIEEQEISVDKDEL